MGISKRATSNVSFAMRAGHEQEMAKQGLAKMKETETKLLKRKKLKQYSISRGYMLTNNHELYNSLINSKS